MTAIREGGEAIKKLGVTASRVTKDEFFQIVDELTALLKTAGITELDWTMGSAGIWHPSHPYHDPKIKKDSAGDVDVLVDQEAVMSAFPPKLKPTKNPMSPEKQHAESVKNSKEQLSAWLKDKGFDNTGSALNVAYPIGDKFAELDIIVKPDAASAVGGHQMDYATDPTMRGSDLWLEIWPTLVKMTPSPLSGKTEIVDVKGKPNSALQLSPDRGIVDRASDKVITSWSDKEKIAKIMVGPHANGRDIASLTGLRKVLQKVPNKWNAVKHLFPESLQEGQWFRYLLNKL
jgi:hypothetical protein